jgi:ABC-type multidrug transport system permease subunit
MVFYSAIIYYLSGQIDEEKRFLSFMLIVVMGMVCAQGIGFIIGIIVSNSEKLAIVLTTLITLMGMLFSNFYIPVNELPKSFRWITYTSIFKLVFEGILILIYGFDRCPEGQISVTLYQLDLNDDNIFWQNLFILITYVIFFRCFALLILIIKANSYSLRKRKTANIKYCRSMSTIYSSAITIPELISYKSTLNSGYPLILEVSRL